MQKILINMLAFKISYGIPKEFVRLGKSALKKAQSEFHHRRHLHRPEFLLHLSFSLKPQDVGYLVLLEQNLILPSGQIKRY